VIKDIFEVLQAGDELMETGKGFHPNLSWSHYRALMRVEHLAAGQFYEEAVADGWREIQRYSKNKNG